MTRKEAVVNVGKATGAGRRAVFEAVVARKHGGENAGADADPRR